MTIKEIESVIVQGLEDYLGEPNRPCPVILANLNTPIPNYPYVAYTFTQSLVENNGTYGIDDKGNRIKQHDCVMSFTVQSDDVDESVLLAIKIARWFGAVGVVYLDDNKIAVKSVGSVLNRDNLISIEYEYRNGLDVTITLLDVIDKSEFDPIGYIDTANVSNS